VSIVSPSSHGNHCGQEGILADISLPIARGSIRMSKAWTYSKANSCIAQAGTTTTTCQIRPLP
jgi:hypothetical protein